MAKELYSKARVHLEQALKSSPAYAPPRSCWKRFAASSSDRAIVPVRLIRVYSRTLLREPRGATLRVSESHD